MYFETKNAGGNELWAKPFHFDKLDFTVSNCHKNTLFFDFWELEMPDFKRSSQIQILRGCQSRNSIGSVWSTKTWKLPKTVKIRVFVINLMKTYLQSGSQKVEKLDFHGFLTLLSNPTRQFDLSAIIKAASRPPCSLLGTPYLCHRVGGVACLGLILDA